MWSNSTQEQIEEIITLQKLSVLFIEESESWNPVAHENELSIKTDTPIELIIMVKNFMYLFNDIIEILKTKVNDQELYPNSYKDMLNKFGSGTIPEIFKRETELRHRKFIELKTLMINTGIVGRGEELDANYRKLSSIIDDSGIFKENDDYSLSSDIKRDGEIFYEPIASWSQFSGRAYIIRYYLRKTLKQLGGICGYSPNFS